MTDAQREFWERLDIYKDHHKAFWVGLTTQAFWKRCRVIPYSPTMGVLAFSFEMTEPGWQLKCWSDAA